MSGAYDSDVNPRQAMAAIILQYNINFAILELGGVAAGIPLLLATTQNIDATVIGVTPIFSSDLDTVVTHVDLVVTEIDAITANPKAGAGVAAGEDDVCGSKDFSKTTPAAAVLALMTLEKKSVSHVIAAGEILKLGIDTAAEGTTLVLTARVYGYRTEPGVQI